MIKGLLLIKRGERIDGKGLAKYCFENGLLGVFVNDMDSIKQIEIGQSTRIVYDKDKLSKETIIKLARSKPGEIIPVSKDELETIKTIDVE